MGGDTEIEKLRRQNRTLKVALFAIIVTGLVGTSLVSVRANRMEQHLRAEGERARAEAERAVIIAGAAREEAESRNAVEPGS